MYQMHQWQLFSPLQPKQINKEDKLRRRLCAAYKPLECHRNYFQFCNILPEVPFCKFRRFKAGPVTKNRKENCGFFGAQMK